MKQITLTQLRKMPVLDIEASLPFELMANSDVLGVVKTDIKMETVRTKCPNCGLVYDAKKPDGKPNFFSVKKVRPETGTDIKFPDTSTIVGGHNA